MKPKFLTKQKQLRLLKIGQVILFKNKDTNYESKKFIVSRSTEIYSCYRGIYLVDYETGIEKYYSFLKNDESILLEDIYSPHANISKPYTYYIVKTNTFDSGKRFRTEKPKSVSFDCEKANLSKFGSYLALFKIVNIRAKNMEDKDINGKYIYSFNFFNPLNLLFIPIYWFIVAICLPEFNNSFFWNNFLFPRFYPFNIVNVSFGYKDFKKNLYYLRMKCKK